MKGFALTGTLIAVGASALLAGLGYFISITNKLETEQKETWAELREKGEKISSLEANVGSLKDDTKEIRADVKELLRRIK